MLQDKVCIPEMTYKQFSEFLLISSVVEGTEVLQSLPDSYYHETVSHVVLMLAPSTSTYRAYPTL